VIVPTLFTTVLSFGFFCKQAIPRGSLKTNDESSHKCNSCEMVVKQEGIMEKLTSRITVAITF
jgi:hypothetical protein